MVHAISLLGIQRFGKEHGSETHSATRWPATVAFTVLAQLCDPKANGRDLGAVLFTNGKRRNFDLTLTQHSVMVIAFTKHFQIVSKGFMDTFSVRSYC